MSNLALAYAMNGEPKRAESMLRQAATSDDNSPRIRQNLALVLGLQGKYDEAKLVAARDMPMKNATDNADYLRQVVKLDPKSVPNSDPLPAEWDTEANIAEAPALTAVPVQKVADVQPMPPVDAEGRARHGVGGDQRSADRAVRRRQSCPVVFAASLRASAETQQRWHERRLAPALAATAIRNSGWRPVRE